MGLLLLGNDICENGNEITAVIVAKGVVVHFAQESAGVVVCTLAQCAVTTLVVFSSTLINRKTATLRLMQRSSAGFPYLAKSSDLWEAASADWGGKDILKN